jgi:hypothetical protein
LSDLPPTSTPPPGIPNRSFYTAAPEPAPDGPELTPLSRRLLQAAGVLSLLLILVVLNSLLSGDEESPFNPNPVAAAAERTQQVPGMRFDMWMQIRAGATPPAAITGKGVYNGQQNLASVAYQATGPEGAPLDFDAVLGEDGWFFRYPEFADRMPEGKEWVKVQGLPGQSDSSKVSESPESSLQTLSAAGAVQRTGQARIRGALTTRYRATLTGPAIVAALRSQGKDELADQAESISFAAPMRADVFIDEHGMLRRVRTVTTVVAEGQTVTTDMRMDLFDFGIDPNIVVPDDSQVLDLTPLLEAKLDALGQAS